MSIKLKLALIFVLGYSASTPAAQPLKVSDGDPEVASFAFDVVNLGLYVTTEEERVSTTSVLRFHVYLWNDGTKPYEMWLPDGLTPYFAELMGAAGPSPWGTTHPKYVWDDEELKPRIVVIEPGSSFEHSYEVDLSETQGIPVGPYVVAVHFPLARRISGELRSFSLTTCSRPFEIVEPEQPEVPDGGPSTEEP